MKIKNKIILSEKERAALKKVQLELFDEFDSFCKRNKLTYYLFGGTLLGAIRHKDIKQIGRKNIILKSRYYLKIILYN